MKTVDLWKLFPLHLHIPGSDIAWGSRTGIAAVCWFSQPLGASSVAP